MINGNMEAGTSQASSVGKKKTKKISDYFLKNEQVFISGPGKSISRSSKFCFANVVWKILR